MITANLRVPKNRSIFSQALVKSNGKLSLLQVTKPLFCSIAHPMTPYLYTTRKLAYEGIVINIDVSKFAMDLLDFYYSKK